MGTFSNYNDVSWTDYNEEEAENEKYCIEAILKHSKKLRIIDINANGERKWFDMVTKVKNRLMWIELEHKNKWYNIDTLKRWGTFHLLKHKAEVKKGKLDWWNENENDNALAVHCFFGTYYDIFAIFSIPKVVNQPTTKKWCQRNGVWKLEDFYEYQYDDIWVFPIEHFEDVLLNLDNPSYLESIRIK